MKKVLLYLIIPLLLSANPFQTTLDDEVSWLKEETFVISASRVKENIKKTAVSMSVITSQEIQNSGATTLMDVLKSIPGIGINKNNLYLKEIEVRGIKTLFSERVLIMLDSHPLDIQLTNGGSTSLHDRIPLYLVDHIEVIRSPASALYGANAFSALINIITKSAEDIDGNIVSTKFGSYGFKDVSLISSHKDDSLEIVSGLYYSQEDGNRIYVQNDAIGNSGTTNPSKKSLGVDLNVKYGDITFKARHWQREDGPDYGLNLALNDEDKFNQMHYFAELEYKANISKNISVNSRLYRDQAKADNWIELYPENTTLGSTLYPDGLLINTPYESIKSGAEVVTFADLEADHHLVGGLMYEIQEQTGVEYYANFNVTTNAPLNKLTDFSASNTTWAPEVTRKFWAAYFEDIWDISDNFRATIGLRYDHYSDFGGATNPRVGFNWSINNQSILKGSYSEGFRAPTFAELYNGNNPSLKGTLDIQPEKVKTMELSLISTLSDDIETTLTLFKSKIDDIIELGSSKYQNSGIVTTKGIEAEIKYSLNRGSYIKANYTYQKPFNKNSNRDVHDVPNHKGNLISNYRLNTHINIYSNLFLKGKTKRALADTRESNAGYGTVDMTLLANNFKSFKGLEFKFTLYNLLDKKYYDPSPANFTEDYRARGINYMGELKYKF